MLVPPSPLQAAPAHPLLDPARPAALPGTAASPGASVGSTAIRPVRRAVRRRSRAQAAPAAPTRLAQAQAPRGAYARLFRPLGEGLLLLLCLPLALPLSAAVALINWWVFRDWRQILYRQPRIGLGGREFQILKFRTMRRAPEGAFASWSGQGDQLRVTRFGRFLRNSHLDELPQLLNILCGEMSFIGPRPEMVEIERWAAAEIPGFGERLCVRPGVTGLAQVAQGYVGNDVEGYRRKWQLSMRYIERFGPRQDIVILVLTALRMLRLEGWRWDPTPRPDSPAGGPRVPTPNRVWD